MAHQDLVIVTGASGFIGSALIERLAGRYALVGFDRAASGEPPPAAECVCIDLTSEGAVKSAFERVRIAYGRRIAAAILAVLLAWRIAAKLRDAHRSATVPA